MQLAAGLLMLWILQIFADRENSKICGIREICVKKHIQIFCIFALFVPIGTFFHELFHYFTAFLFQCETTLFYDSVDTKNCQILNQNCKIILKEKVCLNDFWIYAAGPLGTLLVSVLGLIWLYSDKYKKARWAHLFAIAFSLFHLRILSNTFFGFLQIILNRETLISTDEYFISEYLNLSFLIALLMSNILAVFIGILVWKKLKPFSKIPFLASAVLGFLLGYLGLNLLL